MRLLTWKGGHTCELLVVMAGLNLEVKQSEYQQGFCVLAMENTVLVLLKIIKEKKSYSKKVGKKFAVLGCVCEYFGKVNVFDLRMFFHTFKLRMVLLSPCIPSDGSVLILLGNLLCLQNLNCGTLIGHTAWFLISRFTVVTLEKYRMCLFASI